MAQDDNGKSYSANADVPRNPGPAALGHTPLVGSVRRSNGMRVVRDEVVQSIDDLDAVDVPDKPVLPILNTDR